MRLEPFPAIILDGPAVSRRAVFSFPIFLYRISINLFLFVVHGLLFSSVSSRWLPLPSLIVPEVFLLQESSASPTTSCLIGDLLSDVVNKAEPKSFKSLYSKRVLMFNSSLTDCEEV